MQLSFYKVITMVLFIKMILLLCMTAVIVDATATSDVLGQQNEKYHFCWRVLLGQEKSDNANNNNFNRLQANSKNIHSDYDEYHNNNDNKDEYETKNNYFQENKPKRLNYASYNNDSNNSNNQFRASNNNRFLDSNIDLKKDFRARRYTAMDPSSSSSTFRRINDYSWNSRIIGATTLTFIAQKFYPTIKLWGMKISEKILQGQELYRLITPIFLHGGIGHFGTNMYSLSSVGPSLEQYFGSGRFVATYLISGAVGNIVSALQSPNPALGASGAVFGIVGASFVFYGRHDWLLGRRAIHMQASIMQTVLMNVVLGLANPMIDNWGHLGGAIGGAAMAYYFGPRLYCVAKLDGSVELIDVPIMRLPPSIESIPSRTMNQIRRMTLWMQITKFQSDSPAGNNNKPWREKSRLERRLQRFLPNPNYRQNYQKYQQLQQRQRYSR